MQRRYHLDTCERFPTSQGFLDATQIYPEYLADPNVLLCPSDPGGNEVLTDGRWNFGNDPLNGYNPCLFDNESYVYYPWAFRDEDVFTDVSLINDPATGTFTGVAFVNVNGGFLGAFQVQAGLIATEWVLDSNDRVFEEDMDLGTGTSYRLREGIERFFITDINNPAAGNRAQTEIPVMVDDISAIHLDNFNHMPGGSNILYMDGHVEYIRYPGGSIPMCRGWITLMATLESLAPPGP